MIENEIKFQQQDYRNCINNYLDNKMDKEKNFITSLTSACDAKRAGLNEFYTPYLDKAALNKKFYNNKFLGRLGYSYLNLGRHGYNSHLCKSL
jgi:hypothetical protein